MALASILDEGVVRDLDGLYFGSDWHYMTNEELSTRFQTDLTKGMEMAVASEKMGQHGANIVPSPQPCPAWLCCLLPWLKNTASMRSYRCCIAEAAQTVRSGRNICIDPSSLVQGDIVYIEKDDIVPADCRILTCSDDLFVHAFDCEDFKLHCSDTIGSSRESFLESKNMLYCGSFVTSGQATCIVINIGKDTMMAALIKKGIWPVEKYIHPPDKQRLLPI